MSNSEKKQDKNNQGTKKPEGDSFTRLPNEHLEVLYKHKVFPIQTRLLLYFWRETNGWNKETVTVSETEIANAIEASRRNTQKAIYGLCDSKIIIKSKEPKTCKLSFGFNRFLLGRRLATEPIREKTCDLRSRTPNLRSTRSHKPATTLVALKSAKLVELHRISRPKESIKEIFDISISKKFKDFIDSQPKTTHKRWERLISKILKEKREDESKLRLSLDYVNKEKKDFFGMPIRKSMIAFFESVSWEALKEALEYRIKAEQEKAEKEKHRLENERQVEAAREQLFLNKTENVVEMLPHIKAMLDRNLGKGDKEE